MPGSPSVQLADLAALRRACYWLLGASLLYPTEERRAAIAGAAAELERQSDLLEGFAFYPEWRRLLANVERDVGPGDSDLEETYVELFLGNGNVPLCESAFLSPAAPAQTMATLEQEYRAAGLSVVSSFREPPDHAAVELEFMSLLCEAEARAWTKQSAQDSVKQLEEESCFLERHPSRWFLALAEEVGIRAAGGFYACVTRATHAFIEHDRDLLAALLAQFQKKVRYG